MKRLSKTSREGHLQISSLPAGPSMPPSSLPVSRSNSNGPMVSGTSQIRVLNVFYLVKQFCMHYDAEKHVYLSPIE
jgi:hypothetical protein